MSDLGEAGIGEDAPGADVEFLDDHVLRDDGIPLDGAGAAFARESGRGPREGPADAALPEARAGDEASHCPDAGVALVFVTALPGDPEDACQAGVGGTRLDSAPAGGLAVEVGDQAAGLVRLGVAAAGLLAQPVGAFLGRKRSEGLSGRELVTLALACGRRTARTEHRLQVVPARHVGGHDGDGVFGCRHAHILHVARLAAGQKEVPALARDRQAVSSNELPGFPPDARVLIVNADDCGMYAAVNAAVNAAVIDSIDHWHSEFAQPDGAVSGRRGSDATFPAAPRHPGR